MKDNFDGNDGPQNSHADPARRNGFDPANPNGPSAMDGVQTNGHSRPPVFGFWVALDMLVHRWAWLALGALVGTGAFFLLASHFIKPKFTASAQLIRYESPAAKDFFQSTP